MSRFAVVAINSLGKRIEDSKEADSKEDLVAYFQKKGYTIISVKEDLSFQLQNLLNIEIGSYSLSERVLIAKQLATMISAGIPIIQAISILQEQATKDSLKEKLKKVYKKIESGTSLSQAFQSEEGIFTEVQINLIAAGEKSGRLNEILQKVADDMEKSKNLQGKVLGALIYPIVVFILMFVILTVLVVFMVPQVRELYASFGQEDLPAITEFLVVTSEFLSSPAALILIPLLIASGYLSYRIYTSKEEGRIAVDKIRLKIPIFGSLLGKIQLVEFCRLTSLLLNSGVPVIEALEIVSRALGSDIHSKIVRDSIEDVKKGTSISLSIAKNNIDEAFPPILIRVISTGEESGNLDSVLADLYKFYNAEVEQTTDNLTKAMEPFILVIVGGLVGFLAIAIYLPLYQITEFV